MVARVALLVPLLIATPALAADAPAETRAAGSKHVLKWDATKFPAGSAVTVELSTDGGKTWAEAARGANTGRLVWLVPDKPIIGMSRPIVKPGIPLSTMNNVMPRAPADGSVTADTTKKSEKSPPLMNVFCPFRT